MISPSKGILQVDSNGRVSLLRWTFLVLLKYNYIFLIFEWSIFYIQYNARILSAKFALKILYICSNYNQKQNRIFPSHQKIPLYSLQSIPPLPAEIYITINSFQLFLNFI